METNSRMIALAVTLVCLTGVNTGCATIERHPGVTAFVAGSLVLTAGGALRHQSQEDRAHIPAPSVDCSNPSACR